MKWIRPIYAAQILTGIAGIGAVLVADRITRWHIVVSAIVLASVATSLIVVSQSETDAERNRARLDTLLRSMELPYFIIQTISLTVRSIAKTRDWEWIHQENFERETVYQFVSSVGQHGRLVISEQEFKDLWILEDAARATAIERRLFESDLKTSAEERQDHAEEAIREAISEHMTGPHFIEQTVHADGTKAYTVRLTQTGPPLKIVRFPRERFDDVISMVPLRRYHELADEVNRVFNPKTQRAINELST
jgi:hypothetical protein